MVDAHYLDAPPSDPALALARERDRLRQIVDGLSELAALTLPGDMLMERVVARVREMTGASGAVVELVDGDELEYVAATGTIASSRGLRLPRGASLSGLCVAFRALQTCEDTETDRRVDRAACRRIGARSMLVAPLLHRDEAIGVIKIIAPVPRRFDTLDEYALRLCAGLVSGIVARHLLSEGQRRLLVERSFALQRATAILDASPVATIVHDGEGRVEAWNTAATRLLGWSAADTVGQPLPFLPRERLTLARVDPAAPSTVELTAQHRDGRPLRLRLTAALLSDDGGAPTSFVRTVEVLREARTRAAPTPSELRLRHVTHHGVDAFVSLDADGRVLEWNEAATGLFGWTAGEAQGRRLTELVMAPEHRATYDEQLMQAIATRRSGGFGRRLRLPAVDRDGRAMQLEASLCVTWIDGAPVFDAFLREVPDGA